VLEVDEIGFLRLPDHGLWGALGRAVLGRQLRVIRCYRSQLRTFAMPGSCAASISTGA
jgi:hypothetical protein